MGETNIQIRIAKYRIISTKKWLCTNVAQTLDKHYNDVIMGAIASKITDLTIVYSIVYSDADQRKHQSSGVTGLCVGNSPGTGEFPAQTASNAENVSIWWRHHDRVMTWGYADALKQHT